MAINYFPVFHVRECPAWPTLKRGQTIPKHLWSEASGQKDRRQVGLGFVRAATLILTGQVEVRWPDPGGTKVLVQYPSSSADGGRRIISSDQDHSSSPHNYAWAGADGATAPGLLMIIEAALHDYHYEVVKAWDDLLDVLRQDGLTLPASENDLRRVALSNPEANDRMMHLADCIYFALKSAIDTGELGASPDMPMTIHGEDALPQILKNTTQTPAPLEGGRVSTLLRLARTGGTALLVGPTGTFKTEHAKRAALDAGAKLSLLKGRPGIEDRDFYGGVYPGADGPAWVDGPLTKAFRNAQEGPTVLVIDELLRFEPIYLGALIGALDTYSPAEIDLIGGQRQSDGRHYHLELPNGEGVTAPVENLTIIATTNIGNGYVQYQELDDALLGRFQLIINYDTPPQDEVNPIYLEAANNNQTLVKAVVTLEELTRKRHVGDEGLLARPANPRVSLNLIHETNRRTASGEPLEDAFRGAVEVTIIPYCAPRDTNGTLEASSVAMLQHETNKIAKPLSPR